LNDIQLRPIDYYAYKWQKRTGASDLARERYKRGVEPYYNALKRIILPPKIKGDPANLERMRIVVEALRRTKRTRTLSKSSWEPASF
jgi:hypothetical protein